VFDVSEWIDWTFIRGIHLDRIILTPLSRCENNSVCTAPLLTSCVVCISMLTSMWGGDWTGEYWYMLDIQRHQDSVYALRYCLSVL